MMEGFGNYDGKELSPDVQFLTEYVQQAGDQAWGMRTVAVAENKDDDTLVTTADFINQRLFERLARQAYGHTVAIHGEEGRHLQPSRHAILVAVDSLDGSFEYAATHWDPSTGQLVEPGEPLPPGAIKIEDHQRSSCVVAGVFKNGRLWSVAMYAPFTNELLVADRDLDGTYLNGKRIDLSTDPVAQQATFGPGMPFDFASWRGSLLDPRHLRKDLARPPNGTFSASKQVCDMLTLRSMACVFTGNTLHDILLALAVELANGEVTDLHGNPIDWDNPYGAVYAVNQNVHTALLAAINAPRIDGLPPGYRPVGNGQVSAKEILKLRDQAGFGTERRLAVWRDALRGAHAFVGARAIDSGQLVLASFLTGTARHGTLHDLVVHPEHRRQGLASYAIDRRVELARNYRAYGQTVGMSYLEVDLGIKALGVVPLKKCFESHGFAPNDNGLIRDYRH